MNTIEAGKRRAAGASRLPPVVALLRNCALAPASNARLRTP
jgi:hypothetical protein